MKFIIIFLVMLFGFIVGKNIVLRSEISKACPSFKAPSELLNKSNPVGSPKTQCLMFIPNAGMKHDRSESVSKSKIYNFFSEQLKNFYEAPNEHNVYSNLSGPGKSSQNYDPREDLYIRFPKDKKFDEKANYGVLNSKSDLSRVTKKCSPSFNSVNINHKLDFAKILAGNSLRPLKTRTNPRTEMEPRFFTFLTVLQWMPFRERDQQIMKRYRFFRNNCNKAISKIVNFCLVDPRYDLQYEDMFVMADGSMAFSNVYCKKSSDANWTLIGDEIYRMSAN